MKQKLKSIINLIAKFTPLALFAALGLALAAPQTAQAGKYYKFTFLRVKANPTGSGNGPTNGQLAISELALYDANMTRINRALTKGSAAGSLTAEQAYFSTGSISSSTTTDGTSTVALFDDKNTGNDWKWMVSGTISTLHPYVVMRLADDASPAVFYNLASADNAVTYDNRLPAEWIVEYSTDGSNWSELDHKNLDDSQLPTADRTWYGAGVQVTDTAPQAGFPLQYTQVEYIDSETFDPGEGPALRIFGFHLQADDYIQTKVMFNDVPTSGGGANNHAIFCNRQGSNSSSSFCAFVINGKLRFDYGPAGNDTQCSTATLSKDVEYVIMGDGVSDQKLTATAGSTTAATANRTGTSTLTPSPLTTDLLLFAHSAYKGSGAGLGWDAPQTASDSSLARMKMYYFKVYDAKGSSSLRLDLIPVTVGSQVGMYDQVSGVFYKSVTGTEFTAGGPITTPVTVNLSKITATYGESGWKTFPSITSVTIDGVNIPYADVKNSIDETWNPASITQAGSYTLTVTGKTGTPYADQSATATYTVDKASIDVSSVAFNNGSFPYDGNAHSLAVANLPTGVFVAYSGNSRTDVGSQTVTATLSATDATNYKLTGSPIKTATLSVTKVTPTITAPTISGWVVGGSPSTPSSTVTPAACTPLTYEYSNSQSGPWSSIRPTEKGTYYVHASLSETANWNAVTSPATEFKITAAVTAEWVNSAPSTWTAVPAANNVLLGITPTFVSGTRVNGAWNTSRDLSKLCDGRIASNAGKSNVELDALVAFKSDSVLQWDFGGPTTISKLRIFNTWKNSERENAHINVKSVKVKYAGSDDFTDLGLPNAYSAEYPTTGGGLLGELSDNGGVAFIQNAVSLQLTLGNDESSSIYQIVSEIEAVGTTTPDANRLGKIELSKNRYVQWMDPEWDTFPEVTVKSGTGVTLSSATYDAVWKNASGTAVSKPDNVGVYTLTVTGNGTYSGTLTANYIVEKMHIPPPKSPINSTLRFNASGGVVTLQAADEIATSDPDYHKKYGKYITNGDRDAQHNTEGTFYPTIKLASLYSGKVVWWLSDGTESTADRQVTWKIVDTRVTVKLYDNGGTGGLPSIQLIPGDRMVALSQVPSRDPADGRTYTLEGYYDALTGGTKYYNANGSVAISTFPAKNFPRELWARWSSTADGQWFKLVIRKTKDTSLKFVQLGELGLYDANFNRVNLDLTDIQTPNANGEVAVSTETQVLAMLAGKSAVSASSGSVGQTTARLFDGILDNYHKWTRSGVTFAEGSYPTVTMHLADGAAPVTYYNFASAADTASNPGRAPVSWSLWCSTDGVNWELFDEQDNTTPVTENNTWLVGGGKGTTPSTFIARGGRVVGFGDEPLRQWVRFTITKKNGTSDPLCNLERFAVFDANGNCLNLNLVRNETLYPYIGNQSYSNFEDNDYEHNFKRPADGLAAGEYLYYSGKYLYQSGANGEDLSHNLFRTSGARWEIANVQDLATDSGSTGLGVKKYHQEFTMRLPDNSAQMVAYDLMRYGDAMNSGTRLPVSWTVETSSDGIEWHLFDERRDFTPPTTAHTWYFGANHDSKTTFLQRLANFASSTAKDDLLITGGDLVYQLGEGDFVHVFTNPAAASTFTVNADCAVSVLAIGGGGSGGWQNNNCRSGGGGAGGYVELSDFVFPQGTYSYQVGAGGAKVSGAESSGNDGVSTWVKDSSGQFFITEAKGGGGGAGGEDPHNGGCGGGSAYNYARGVSTQDQTAGSYGFAGGSGPGTSGLSGAGGGGAGGVGRNASGDNGGAGGDGRLSSILGFDQYFAGGGGGSSWWNQNLSSITLDEVNAHRAPGGSGVGGFGGLKAAGGWGGSMPYPGFGGNGEPGTGSGGGSCAAYSGDGVSGAGGSGILVIRVTDQKRLMSVEISKTTAMKGEAGWQTLPSVVSVKDVNGDEVTKYSTSWSPDTVTDVGTYTLTVTGTDDYHGTVTATYEVTGMRIPAPLSTAESVWSSGTIYCPTPSPDWWNDTYIKVISGSRTATAPGVYTVKWQPKNGATWEDGKTDGRETKWTVKQAVTLDKNGGDTDPDPATVAAALGAVMPDLEPAQFNITRAGYIFAGFYDHAEGGDQYYNAAGKNVRDYPSTGYPTTLYAHWTSGSYYISYSLGTGGVPGDHSPAGGINGTVLEISRPNRPGYKFGGWRVSNADTSTAKHGSNADQVIQSINNGYLIAGPANQSSWWFKDLQSDGKTVTLTADWTENSYTVNFNANGGSGTMSAQTYKYTDSKALSASTFTRNYTVSFDSNGGSAVSSVVSAYTVSGWATSPDGEQVFAVGQTVTGADLLPYVSGGAVTLYAVWQPVAVALPTPTKSGYSFAGWYVNTKRIESPYVPTADVTLLAHWSESGYTVSYALDGGSYGAKHPGTADVGTAFEVSEPTKTGYDFKGWKVTGVAGGKAKCGDSQTAVTTTVTEGGTYGSGKSSFWFKDLTTAKSTVTLTATWEAQKCILTFHMEGGEGGTTQITATYGQMPPNITPPTKAGYRFLGYWDFTNGKQYYDANGHGILVMDMFGSSTQKARWEQATVTVTLHGNGGTPDSQTVDATPGAAMPTPITIPTREGYTFQGYSTESWDVSYMTGDPAQDVYNEGTVVFAKLVGSGNAMSVNGVSFETDLADATARSTVMGLEGTWTKEDKGSYQDEGQSDGFGQILKNGIFQDGLTTANVTLKGLTSGRLYLFQLFVHDGRGSYCNRTVSEDGENWMKYGNPSGAGGTGKYGVSLIRRFVATGTEETVRVYFNYSSPGGISAQINAAQLRDLGATSVLGKYYNDDGTSAKNYPVENGPTELFAQWTKAVQTVSRPTQTWTSSPYNGTVQKPSYPAADGYTVAYSDGDWKKVGSDYTVTFALKPNWQWASGADTSLPIVFNYEITKAEISAVTLTATSETYDGQPHQPTVASVTASGTEFNSTSAGTAGWAVTYSRGGSSTVDFTSVGTITVTVTGTKNLTGSASTSFTITAPTVTVTLDANRGALGTTKSVQATYGQPMPVIAPANLPTRTGYTFAGFFENNDGSGKQYYNADGTSANNYDKIDASTIYANWTENTYNVAYVWNGGTTTQTPLYDSRRYGRDRLQMSVPTKAGSVFIGWTVSGFGTTAHWYKLEDDGKTYIVATKTYITSDTQLCIDGEKDIVFFNLCDNEGETATLTANWNEIISVPTAVSLTYTGTEQMGVLESTTYTITGHKATNAGNNYEATVTPKSGYCWDDGSTTSKTVPWSIGKAVLTVVPDDKTITYGDAAPTYTYHFEGFVNKEDAESAGVTGAPWVGSTTYSAGKDCATYDIVAVINGGSIYPTPNPLSAPNYSFSYDPNRPGKLTVVQREVTLTWGSTHLVYTGAAQKPDCTLGNTISGDAVSVTVSGERTEVGTGYTATAALNGTKSGNYKLPANPTTTFDIYVPDSFSLSAIEKGGPVIENIPATWLTAAFPSVAKTQTAYQDAFISTNVNGVTGWAAYILGFAGSDVPTAAIIEKTTASEMSDNKVALTIALPDLPATTRAESAGCTLAYSLLTSDNAETLRTGGGTNAVDAAGEKCEKCAESSFTVPAPAANHAYYRIRIHFIFAGGGDEVVKVFSMPAGLVVSPQNLADGWTKGLAYDDLYLQTPAIDLTSAGGLVDDGYVSVDYTAVHSRYNTCYCYINFLDSAGNTITTVDAMKSVCDGFQAGDNIDYPAVFRIPIGADVSNIKVRWVDSNAARVKKLTHADDDMSFSDLNVEVFGWQEAVRRSDEVCNEQGGIDWTAFAAAKTAYLNKTLAGWTRNLPNMQKALRGEAPYNTRPYNILVTGDSLAPAPLAGCLEALIKDQWPNSNIRMYIAWNSNTGCYQYMDTSHESNAILKSLDFTKYDCVMYTGTTQVRYSPGSGDYTFEQRRTAAFGAIGSMTTYIKTGAGTKANPSCEIIMVSPLVSVDARLPWNGLLDAGDYWNSATYHFDQVGTPCDPILDWNVANDGWADRDYNPVREQMADECQTLGIAHWDLYRFAYDYLFRSGKPYDFYQRDAQHQNNFGNHLAARVMLEAFKIVGGVTD